MRKFVLTGGPCAGKTTLAEALVERGVTIVPEAAIQIIEQLIDELGPEAGPRWRRDNPQQFQTRIARLQRQQERAAEGVGAERIVCDRGLFDGLAYCTHAGVAPPSELVQLAAGARYDGVFLLDTLDVYDPRRDSGRTETLGESVALRDALEHTYRGHGYEPQFVAAAALEVRLEQVLQAIGRASAD